MLIGQPDNVEGNIGVVRNISPYKLALNCVANCLYPISIWERAG